MNLFLFLYLFFFTAMFFFVLRFYLKSINFFRIKNYIERREKEIEDAAGNAAQNMLDISSVIETDMQYFKSLKQDLENLTQNFDYKKNELTQYIRQVDKAYIALSKKNLEMNKTLQQQNADIKKMNSLHKNVVSLNDAIGQSMKNAAKEFADKEKKLMIFEQKMVAQSKLGFEKLEKKLVKDFSNLSKSSIAEMQKTIDGLQNKHNEEVHSLNADLDTTKNVHETLREQYKKLLADMKDYRANLQTNIEQVVDVMIGEFKEKIETFQEITMDGLTSTYENLQKQADVAKLEVSERERQMIAEFSKMREENDLFKKEFFDKNANYIHNLQNQLKELMHAFEEIENKNAVSKNRLEDINEFFDDAENLIISKTNAQSKVFDKKRKEFESGLQTKYKKVEEEVGKFSEMLSKEEVRQKITKEQLVENSKKILLSQKTLEKDLSTSFLQQNKRLEENLNGTIADVMNKVVSEGEEKIQLVLSDLQQLVQQQKKATTESKNEVIKIRERISKKIGMKQMTEKILKDISKTVEGDVRIAFEAANKQLFVDLNKTKASLKETSKEIDAIEKNKKQSLEKLVENFQDKVKKIEGSLVKDISVKTSLLEKNIRVIGSRVDSFLKETNAFKKTEQLARSLKNELKLNGEQLLKARRQNQELKQTAKTFDKLLEEKQNIESFDSRLQQYQVQMKSVEKSIAGFSNEQFELAKNFKKWENNKKEISVFLEKAGEYKKVASSAKREMEKLATRREEAQSALEAVKEWQRRMKAAHENSSRIEKRVERSTEMEAMLKKKLEDLETKSVYLQENYRNLGDFQTKYDQLDFLVEDMDMRMKAFEEMRRKLLVERNEMQELRNKFDEQIKTVLQFAYSAVPGSTRKISETKEIPVMVRRLHSIGWKKKEIAEQLKIPLSEVDLHIED